MSHLKREPFYKLYTRGGQTSLHDIRMWEQITKTLGLLCLFLFVGATGLLMWTCIPSEKLMHALVYYYALLLDWSGKNEVFTLYFNNVPFKQSVLTILKTPYYAYNARQMEIQALEYAFTGMLISIGAGIMLVLYFVKRGRNQSQDRFVRGVQRVEPKELVKQLHKAKDASDLKIDAMPLVKNAEVQHMLVHGTIGMGKSQLIMKLLDQLRARGDRVIIYDKGCSFTARYFDTEKDVLLNPFDSRCANWDLWTEAPTETDLENMAASLIPIEGDPQPFFVHAARAVFSASAERMRQDEDCSLTKLLQFLLTGEFSQMEPYLKGTSAATLMSSRVDKMAISVRSMITTYMRSLRALQGLDKGDKPKFSIRDYIRDEEQKGWLFISSNGEQHHTLKPLLTMWLSTASLALLSLPENLNRRVWFICDELPTLHRLPFLTSTLAEGRKFGACFVLGMQNVAQLSDVYGREGAKALFDLLNTRFYFRSPSADIAQFVSAELCKEELDEARESTSYGANTIRDGVSISHQRQSRALVDYSEIMTLEVLHCFLRFPGQYPITKIGLQLQKRPEIAAHFEAREMPKDSEQETFIFEQASESGNNDSGLSLDKPLKSASLQFEALMD